MLLWLKTLLVSFPPLTAKCILTNKILTKDRKILLSFQNKTYYLLCSLVPPCTFPHESENYAVLSYLPLYPKRLAKYNRYSQNNY